MSAVPNENTAWSTPCHSLEVDALNGLTSQNHLTHLHLVKLICWERLFKVAARDQSTVSVTTVARRCKTTKCARLIYKWHQVETGQIFWGWDRSRSESKSCADVYWAYGDVKRWTSDLSQSVESVVKMFLKYKFASSIGKMFQFPALSFCTSQRRGALLSAQTRATIPPKGEPTASEKI